MALVDLAEARKNQAREPGLFVETSSGTMHALVRGAGPDVVLLHGVTDNAHTWLGVQAALENTARTHAIDLPGHGLTDFPDVPLTARGMATWVASYFEAQRIERAVVVGWSLGGSVAAAFTAEHSSRVAGVVFVAPAVLEFPFPSALFPLKLPGAGETMHLLGANESLRRFFMASTFARDFAPSASVLSRYWRGWQIKGRARYIRALLQSFSSSEVTPLLGGIRTPAWVVHGDDDGIVPARVGRDLAAVVPGAALTALAKVGHAPHIEREGAVIDAIGAALRSS